MSQKEFTVFVPAMGISLKLIANPGTIVQTVVEEIVKEIGKKASFAEEIDLFGLFLVEGKYSELTNNRSPLSPDQSILSLEVCYFTLIINTTLHSITTVLLHINSHSFR